MRVIKPFVDQKKASIRKLLRIVGLSKSSYYYESTSGKRGTPASTVTIKSDGTHVSNADVVALIQTLLMEQVVLMEIVVLVIVPKFLILLVEV